MHKQVKKIIKTLSKTSDYKYQHGTHISMVNSFRLCPKNCLEEEEEEEEKAQFQQRASNY